MAKTEVKKTGINKGIEKGVPEAKFLDRVICKHCGKEINFTIASNLFLKCPRCGGSIERDLKKEEKQSKEIIKKDILLRSKRAWLAVALVFTACAVLLAVGIIYSDINSWFLYLAAPLLVVSVFLARITRKHGAGRRFRFYARILMLANCLLLCLLFVDLIVRCL